MPRSPSQAAQGVAVRLASFVLERFPFALSIVQEVLDASGADRVGDSTAERDASRIESFRAVFRRELKRALDSMAVGDTLDPTPGVTRDRRIEAARKELLDACDGFLAREALAASLTPDERREMLRGMVLTRATDN